MAVLMTSCREKTDFDAIANGVSEKTLQGYFSGAEVFGDTLMLSVVQYNFAEDGTVERTTMEIGDGAYKAPETKKYSSWQFGEYFDGNKGRNLNLIPAEGGDPLKVKFYLGGILEDGQPTALDKNNKVDAIASTNEDVVGKKWVGSDTTFYKIDTVVNVMKYDSIFKRTGYKKDDQGNIIYDENGQPLYERVLVRVDSTEVPTKMKWPIAPKTINIRRVELYRDPTTLANTGKWYMLSQEFDINDKRETTIKKDTTSSYDFRWTYYTYSSTSTFMIKAVQENGEVEFFEFGYDFKLPSVTVDKQVLKIEE